jgi:hypothetical protein
MAAAHRSVEETCIWPAHSAQYLLTTAVTENGAETADLLVTSQAAEAQAAQLAAVAVYAPVAVMALRAL